MTSVKPLGTRQIADRLHSAAIRLLRRLRGLDAEAGLTSPQSSALSVLVYGGPTSLGRLAEAELVRAPTMSRLIKDMEALGLVERVGDTADRRRATLHATPKGRARLDLARAARLGRLERALGKLSPDELAVIAQAAQLLLDLAESPQFDA